MVNPMAKIPETKKAPTPTPTPPANIPVKRAPAPVTPVKGAPMPTTPVKGNPPAPVNKPKK